LTNRIAIIGSGGHARSAINLLKDFFGDVDVIGIYDDSFVEGSDETINSIPLVGDVESLDLEQLIFLSIGDNSKRKRYFIEFYDCIIKENLFHKSSFCEQSVVYGMANQFFANSYINSQTLIGDNNIINTGAIIEHEVVIGSHNHISVGARLCGRSSVGSMCFIGAGAIIIDKIKICDNVVIGAGSVVIQDIKEAGVYVGNPARKVK